VIALERLELLVDKGARVQVTAAIVAGEPVPERSTCARKWLTRR
jgi:hypothetical protein